MRYLVDGYNLLHATGHLSGKVGPHGLEKARRTLLDRLAVLAKSGAGVTVVFDAPAPRRPWSRNRLIRGSASATRWSVRPTT